MPGKNMGGYSNEMCNSGGKTKVMPAPKQESHKGKDSPMPATGKAGQRRKFVGNSKANINSF